jgi:uncharacterized membrane protein
MHISQLHYLPLTPPFFLFLVGLFLVLVLVLQIGALRYAYMWLGVTSRTALLLLLSSLIGSYINLPLAEMPGQHIVSGEIIDFFGIQHVVPVVIDWPATVLAVNVGGALIPGCMSLYLLIRHRLWWSGLLAVGAVSIVCHLLAEPVAGLGIALPIFVPTLAAAVVALLLSRQHAAPLAYIGGSLGTLVGADLMNLDKVQGLGAPVASIGGAGTFDGIFLVGVLAVLIASIRIPRRGTQDARSTPGTANHPGVS